MKNSNSKKGFTLIETLIGVSVIALVITAAAELTQGSIKLSDITNNQFAAYHIAEQGIELVRNKRDSNWLQNRPWNDGLQNGTYVIRNIVRDIEGQPNWIIETGEPEATDRFKRRIEIRYEPADANVAAAGGGVAGGEVPTGTGAAVQEDLMHVTSIVSYKSRSVEKEVKIETVLTNWRKGPL